MRNNSNSREEKDSSVVVLEEPGRVEILDEPVPEVFDSCCCPCPKIVVAGPFLAFGPLQ